jgi:uncharacterized membrane protein YgcG
MQLLYTLIFLLLTITLSGQAYLIDSVDVDIEINEDGAAEISERFYINFNERQRGIIRKIPYKYSFEQRLYSIKIKNIDVSNEHTKITRERGYTHIRIGDPSVYLTGKKEYQIKYTVEGPFIRSEDYDEFYWNITGNEWDTSIGKASFKLLIHGVEDVRYNNIRYFTGRLGANEKGAKITSRKNLIEGYTTRLLFPGEGLTVAIKLPYQYVKKDRIIDIKAVEAVEIKTPPSKWWSMIPGSIIVAILGWWKGLRGSKIEYDIIPITYPPKSMSPAEVGTFIDNIPHDRDILALIPYWANMGCLKITRMPDNELIFEKLKPLGGERPAYEHEFYSKVFEKGPKVQLSDINKNMYVTIHKTKAAIKKEMVKEKLYDERYIAWFRSWKSVPVGFALLIPAILLMIKEFHLMGMLFLAAAAVYFILRAFNPPPSEKGLALRGKLKGLEAHLKSETPEVISSMIERDPAYYERLFPYAFALGLENSWNQKVTKYYNHAPYWYHTHTSMNGNSGLKNLNEVFTPKKLSSAFIKVPTGSSSSGSFSGGSSGGGFGGGGGSSW